MVSEKGVWGRGGYSSRTPDLGGEGEAHRFAAAFLIQSFQMASVVLPRRSSCDHQRMSWKLKASHAGFVVSSQNPWEFWG